MPLAGCRASAAGVRGDAPAGADLTETGVSRLATAAGVGVSPTPAGASSCAGWAIIVDDALGTGVVASTAASGDGVTVGSAVEPWAVGAVVGIVAADASVGRPSVMACVARVTVGRGTAVFVGLAVGSVVGKEVGVLVSEGSAVFIGVTVGRVVGKDVGVLVLPEEPPTRNRSSVTTPERKG